MYYKLICHKEPLKFAINAELHKYTQKGLLFSPPMLMTMSQPCYLLQKACTVPPLPPPSLSATIIIFNYHDHFLVQKGGEGGEIRVI